MKRKYEAQNVGQFLFKVLLYMRYGYLRYAVREIPEGADLERVDEKILHSYQVTYHRTTRANRKKKGRANVVYIRFERMFILMCSKGTHEAFEEIVSHHFRDEPFCFAGYSIGMKQGKPHLIITPQRMKAIRKQTYEIALHNEEKVTAYFQQVSPFSFEGINQQRWKLLREVNQRRKVAGLPRIRWEEVKKWKGQNAQ